MEKIKFLKHPSLNHTYFPYISSKKYGNLPILVEAKQLKFITNFFLCRHLNYTGASKVHILCDSWQKYFRLYYFISISCSIYPKSLNDCLLKRIIRTEIISSKCYFSCINEIEKSKKKINKLTHTCILE